MQSRPAQRLGNLDLAHAGVQSFQTLYDVADEVREFIYRFTQLHQCVDALFIDAFHPRRNRGRRDEKGVGRLFEGPAPGGT